jgi:hypothetical protein
MVLQNQSRNHRYFYIKKINLKTYKTTTKNNWTMFENPDFRFYQSIKFNAENNKAKMPSFILTNKTISINKDVFWPDYFFERSLHVQYNLYKKKKIC